MSTCALYGIVGVPITIFFQCSNSTPATSSEHTNPVQQVHRLDGASQSRICRSAISSGPLFHSPPSTHTHRLLNNPKSTQVRSSGTMTRHYSPDSGNIFPVFFDPQTKAEEKPLGVWSERIYQCLQRPTSPATLSAKQIMPNPGILPAKVVYQKQYHLMSDIVPVRPQSRYPRAPRETEFTLSQPQLHPPTSHYSNAYIRKPADEFNGIFLWTTEP
jgi:hypothetical protein